MYSALQTVKFSACYHQHSLKTKGKIKSYIFTDFPKTVFQTVHFPAVHSSQKSTFPLPSPASLSLFLCPVCLDISIALRIAPILPAAASPCGPLSIFPLFFAGVFLGLVSGSGGTEPADSLAALVAHPSPWL